MSMKDRGQKAKALRYCVAKRWFPQLEVDVRPSRRVGKAVASVTDLDVFASIPDDFNGFRVIVFDCKTRARESAVNRSLWLRGVLDRIQAETGICILKKFPIESDHKLAATKLDIVLLAEDEFDIFANSTCTKFADSVGATGDIGIWESFFMIHKRFPKLETVMSFSRSGFWMIQEAADACRQVISNAINIRSELDPAKSEHMCIAYDLAGLFSHALARMCSYLFKAYLHPKKQSDLEEAVKILIYGGRDSYEHRNRLYMLLKEQKGTSDVKEDLSLPEWQRFMKLIRQLLDAPLEVARVPLILREVGLNHIKSPAELSFARTLCQESPQAAGFAVLIAGYLFRASRLPDEFRLNMETEILGLMK